MDFQNLHKIGLKTLSQTKVIASTVCQLAKSKNKIIENVGKVIGYLNLCLTTIFCNCKFVFRSDFLKLKLQEDKNQLMFTRLNQL